MMNKEEIKLTKYLHNIIENNISLRKENDRLWKQKLEYIDRISKAITDIETTIQIIKEQPSKNVEEDNYILSRLESFVEILRGKK